MWTAENHFHQPDHLQLFEQCSNTKLSNSRRLVDHLLTLAFAHRVFALCSCLFFISFKKIWFIMILMKNMDP